jgi:hypothetical protein
LALEIENSSTALLGVGFGENGECATGRRLQSAGDGKATNNNLAKVKTGFGINSSEWDQTPKFLQLTEGLEDIPLLGDEDRFRHQGIVDGEIRTRRLDSSRRKERLQDMAGSEVSVRRVSYHEEAAEKARKEIKVRGEPDVIKILLDLNTTPEQVRALCGEAFMNRRVEVEAGVVRDVKIPAWPIPSGSALPTYLSQYAEQYVAALHDVRAMEEQSPMAAAETVLQLPKSLNSPAPKALADARPNGWPGIQARLSPGFRDEPSVKTGCEW